MGYNTTKIMMGCVFIQHSSHGCKPSAHIVDVERFEFEFVLGKGEGGKREASLLREVK